jgi:hypothetical protein
MPVAHRAQMVKYIPFGDGFAVDKTRYIAFPKSGTAEDPFNNMDGTLGYQLLKTQPKWAQGKTGYLTVNALHRFRDM